MKKPVAIFFAIVLLALSTYEIYNTWNSREIYFEKEPQFVIRDVAHILLTPDYLAVTYKKGDVLVKERFQRSGTPKLRLVVEKAKGRETYINVFLGLREPMLWLKDSESDPPAVLFVIYCGSNISDFDFCDSFNER